MTYANARVVSNLQTTRIAALLLAMSLGGCGDEIGEHSDTGDMSSACEPFDVSDNYASELVVFSPGPNAGYGQNRLPDIVLGPPSGRGELAASLNVLSLGVGGEIILGFDEQRLIDGPGPDFVVFENPFWPGGDPAAVFAEPGEVAVSADGEVWHTFPCDADGDGMGNFVGCAGWTPTWKYDPCEVIPLDPERTGGDAFDLADVGLNEARYVRIRDLATTGEGTTAGFDLDAVGIVLR